MKLYYIFLVSIVLLVVGCGPAFLPSPTKKSVNIVDLVGVWEYSADYGKINVTLELKKDGTFTQSIVRKIGKKLQIHNGNWKLDGASFEIILLKPVFEKHNKPWILEKANWWIMDSVINNNVKFSICGAADDRDPDSCFEMKKTSLKLFKASL